MFSKEDLISFSVELVQNNIERTVRGIGNLGSDAIKKVKIKSGNAFNTYLDTAIRKYTEIKTILYRDAPVFLYEFYEDSELSIEGLTIDASDINNIVSISDKIIITGSAGIGKSTLMKHLFLNTIANKKRIPIFVELKNINNVPNITNIFISGEYTLLDFIYHSVSLLNFSLEKEYFIKAINNGNLFFYFDGFDEVNPEIREQVAQQIIQLSDKYYENIIIVSSRPDENFVSWNNFTEVTMVPLSKQKAINLVKKIKYDLETKEKFIDELDKGLYEKHKSFASNPLLLTIMLMSFFQYSDIPEKIHLFYQQAFETLFSKHDSTKGGYKRKMYTKLAVDDFVKVLSAFSIQSYSNNNISFDYSTITKYLEGAKKITSIDYETYSYYRDLCESVSLLVKDGLLYTFSHRIFQEYFTAIFIINSSDERQKKLIDRLSSRFRTDNVFNMLFEMDRNRIEKNFIIPALEDIKNITKFEKVDTLEACINFISHVFSHINIKLNKEASGKQISLSLNNRETFEVSRIAKIKYQHKYPQHDQDIKTGDLKVIMNKYYPLANNSQIKVTDVFNYVEDKREVVESFPLVSNFIFLMKVLKELKIEHDQLDQSIENILFEAN